MSTPTVLVFPTKFVRGWPGDDDPRAVLAESGDVLAQRFSTDAHLVAYAADVTRRLTVDLLRNPAHARHAHEAGVRMTLALFDVDGPGHVDGRAYSDAEWSAEQPKLAALLGEHPGGFVYRTRGGYRIVYGLPEPVHLRACADDAAWRSLYLGWCRHLARRFKIRADLSCADWTRVFRVPHATRDGVPQDLAAIGGPDALGVWSPELSVLDRVHVKPLDATSYASVEPVPISDPGNGYGRARIGAAARYLDTAPLSIKGDGGRSTMFTVCLVLVRRMRLPLDVAADVLEAIYIPRLRAAGTSTWSRDVPGPHGGSLMERFEKARDTGTVPPGDVVDEEFWNLTNPTERTP